MQETQVRFLGLEDPLEKWQPTPVFLPRKSHGQRSLAGYGPWGHKRVGHDLATKQHQPTKPWAWYWWFQRESKQVSLVMEDRLAKLVSDLDSVLQGQGVAGNWGRLFKEGWEVGRVGQGGTLRKIELLAKGRGAGARSPNAGSFNSGEPDTSGRSLCIIQTRGIFT